jgi:hypothetical protein
MTEIRTRNVDSAVTLSIIIPTPDGEHLARTLASIAGQPLAAGDEVWVIGDTHGRELPDVQTLVEDCGPAYHYLPCDAGRHAMGHPQINYGMQQAAGEFLVFQDDDDVFVPGAFDAIRRRSLERRPHLFRFVASNGVVYWSRWGLVQCAQIGGHCIVAPNDPQRLGSWTDRYEGDFDFIAETLAHYPEEPVWCPEIISVQRPRWEWRMVQSADEVERLRVLRNVSRTWMTGNTTWISAEQQRRWWESRDPGKLRAYLFAAESGAGVLSCREDGRWWVTVMVDPVMRRLGMGTYIYRMLAHAAPTDGVWAGIRDDNIPSIRAAEKAGYQLQEAGVWRFRHG